jgi:hypothetical protein
MLELGKIINQAKAEKPNDRSDRDRYHAIFITELEKVAAYYQMYCVEPMVIPVEASDSEKQLLFSDDLVEGNIVHYVMPDHQHRPAIIVQVWDREHIDGACSLIVFVDGTNDVKRNFNDPIKETVTNFWEPRALHSETHEPGTWHWIE